MVRIEWETDPLYQALLQDLAREEAEAGAERFPPEARFGGVIA